VGTVGTTSTGAVDFIAEIGQTRKSYRGYSSLHQ
jgi:glutamate/tyrosine decarboxylase-like PLP-dependent enzyme